MIMMEQPSPQTVLVIDDDPVVCESIAVYLGDSGYRILRAGDGQAGIDMFRNEGPDIVLVDLRMPRVDGLTVLSTVTGESPNTPVIVVSGTGILQDAIEALRLGAQDFVTKPILDMAVLEHAVEKALERARLKMENLRYKEHLEDEIARRTQDLKNRTSALAQSNRRLEIEISEHRKTESALRESEGKLSAVVEVFDGFIYTCTEDYRISFMNRKMIEKVGRDAIGETCYRGLYGQDEPCSWCALDRVYEKKTVRREIQDPETGIWYYAIHVPIFDSEGRVSKAEGILIDITDRKMAEEELKAREDTLKKENIRLRSSMAHAQRLGKIIGKSSAMQGVYDTIFKAARSSANVIIYGESGTGKELVAATIHELSDRSDKPFITVNCGAIPESLIESELFGYKKGAFTGAVMDKPGYLEMADGGTLFLDEIGEIDANMQVKLLRAIEGGGYTPVGGSDIKKPEIRFISATNRDLKDLVTKGVIREDFYYRVHIIPIHLPPLRQRKDDIPLLIQHFLQEISDESGVISIPAPVMKSMQKHQWPGNVRELQNAVHRYVTLKEFEGEDFVGERMPLPAPSELETGADSNLDLAQMIQRYEKQVLKKVLEDHRWHRGKTARVLGIDRRTLFRKIRSHGLE